MKLIPPNRRGLGGVWSSISTHTPKHIDKPQTIPPQTKQNPSRLRAFVANTK
jgi:hypothetical protein